MPQSRRASSPHLLRSAWPLSVGSMLLAAALPTHAQMVPRTHLVTGHTERITYSSPGGDLAIASIGLNARGRSAPTGQGEGLSVQDPDAIGLWPHWEGRIGVVLDRPNDPMRSPFVLAQPAGNGLKVHSMHLLSDYYFSGGFRATAGLVRGDVSMPWWPSGQQGSTGLNLSLRRIDMLPIPDHDALDDGEDRTMPYLGAGYSTRLNEVQGYGAWKFNADLGLISVNSGNIARLGRMLQGEQGIEDLLRELRLRPVIKFTVNYAF